MSIYLEAALRSDVLRTALKVALVVGTILALINHGPALLSLSLTSSNLLQILLTYLVPYCVSTHSAARLIVANQCQLERRDG